MHDDQRRPHLEHRLAEACDALWDDFVDPREAYATTTAAGGCRSATSGGSAQRRRRAVQRAAARASPRPVPPAGRDQRVRHQRPREPHQLHRRPGHSYRADRLQRQDAPARRWRCRCRRCSTSSSHENRWQRRQQEIVRRMDRDGEAFLRFFVDRDGLTRVRFVEPDQVATPPSCAGDPSASFGIQTEPTTSKRVLGYYIDGELVDAARHPASQGERRRQREARPAAVSPGAQESAAGREAAAQHERRGRDPVGDRADPQAPRREPQRHRAVRRRRGRRRGDQRHDRPHAAFLAVRPGHDPRRAGRPGIRLPRRAASTPRNFVTVLQAELRAIAAGW